MSRILVSVSAITLLAAVAHAQCQPAPAGPAVTLLSTTGGFYPVDDEGRTQPAVPLGFTFPMAGTAFGPGFTHVFIESNGELYLTNNLYGTVGVLGNAYYGINYIDELRGTGALFSNPRIVGFGGDNEAGNGGTYSITVDTSVPNQCTINWNDMQDYNGNFPYMSSSWATTLYSTGVVDFHYGSGLPTGQASFNDIIVGISVGDSVGTFSEPEQDMTSGTADSGTLGLLYEHFPYGTGTDLGSKTVRITPNGIGGFIASVVCEGASHEEYGVGCYELNHSVYELHPDAAMAQAALTGNALSLTNNGSGYTLNWLPGVAGAMYVAPSGTATPLFPNDDGSDTIVPSVAMTVPGGTETDLTISHNGIITCGPFGNNDWNYYPNGQDLADATGRAFYAWHDYADTDTGSGQIKYEEANVGGNQILYVTWDNVDMWPIGVVNLGTMQYQINLTTGNVMILWTVVDPDTSSFFGSQHLVGYTGPGAGTDPGSVNFATSPSLNAPDAEHSLALSASPPPVFTIAGPSVPITYQIDNLHDLSPALPGFFLASLVFSFNPPIVPGGIDLTLVGIDAPGCNLNVGSLDVLYNISPTGTSHGEVIVVPQPLAPGTTFYVQAANFIIPNSLPGGLNNFGLIVSNGVRSRFDLF
jgi:hypothetical protein